MVGSLNPAMQDQREKSGWGANLSTLLDAVGIVGDAATGNWAGAGTGLIGFVDGASGGKLLSDEQEAAVDVANAATSLTGAVTNPNKGVKAVKAAKKVKDVAQAGGKAAKASKDAAKAAKAAAKAAKAANKAKSGVKVAKAAKTGLEGFDTASAVARGGNALGSVQDTASIGGNLADMVAKGGNATASLGNAGGALSAAGGNSIDLAQMISQATPEMMAAASAKGIKPGLSLNELMTKLQQIQDSPGMGMAKDAVELGQLYQEMTKGPPAPGMASGGGGGYQPGTVAEKFMSRS